MCVYTFCDREKSLVLRLDTGFVFFFTDLVEPACYSLRNLEDVPHLLLRDIEGNSGFILVIYSRGPCHESSASLHNCK